jgi:hypothetical protein
MFILEGKTVRPQTIMIVTVFGEWTKTEKVWNKNYAQTILA